MAVLSLAHRSLVARSASDWVSQNWGVLVTIILCVLLTSALGTFLVLRTNRRRQDTSLEGSLDSIHIDSSKNPFRVWVAESMHSCPPLYHCILSMSASHLAARQQDDLVLVALEHRAEAISGLGSEILGGDLQSSLKACSSYEGLSRALLACILLGMTDVRHP